MRSSHRPALLALFLAAVAGGAPAQELGDAWGTANAEAEHYRIVELPIPRELALECGSFVALPEGKLAIGTRRGEILIVDGAFEPLTPPKCKRAPTTDVASWESAVQRYVAAEVAAVRKSKIKERKKPPAPFKF